MLASLKRTTNLLGSQMKMWDSVLSVLWLTIGCTQKVFKIAGTMTTTKRGQNFRWNQMQSNSFFVVCILKYLFICYIYMKALPFILYSQNTNHEFKSFWYFQYKKPIYIRIELVFTWLIKICCNSRANIYNASI